MSTQRVEHVSRAASVMCHQQTELVTCDTSDLTQRKKIEIKSSVFQIIAFRVLNYEELS